MSDKKHSRNDECCGTEQSAGKTGSESGFRFLKYWKPIFSLLLLLMGLLLDYLINAPWFTGPLRLIWYIAAYIPVGFPVLKQAAIHLKKGDVFTEFFLMGLATVGAFYIGEYPEGVGVMLFYSIGEAFQHNAADSARESIRALLDVRPKKAHVKRDYSISTVHPEKVEIGEIIQVKPGERVPLDGRLLMNRSAFDTSALTGESKPRNFQKNEKILAGMVNLNQVIELEVCSTYDNSSISRILKMVQEASSRKAKTELFIRSFARIYTPGVVFFAALLVIFPVFFVTPYVFNDWLYRGLVFLVISCPCALVISIPLGYFGGIGAASRNGILVKGSNYLDTLRSVTTVVFDKTGTLTKGTFTVQNIDLDNEDDELLTALFAVEQGSTHPVAMAINDYLEDRIDSVPAVTEQNELPGYGIQAVVAGKQILIGNRKLMIKQQIPLNGFRSAENGSLVHIAVEGEHKGTITISDQIKEDSVKAIEKLRELGVRQTVLLSGDILSEVRKVGKELGIDYVYAELLPGDKAQKLEDLKAEFPGVTAYAGDGINDAPVLALSDVGVAMGAMGSDAAIETADVVIQTDQPSKIATAIKIGRATRNIVWQNIGLALGIKVLFLGLGAFGLATLWEAVIADVGVAFLAILNAIRIQKINFD